MLKFLRNTIVLALLLATTTFSIASALSTSDLTTDKKQKIDSYLEQWQKHWNIPTIQLGILENGKLSYVKTYGNQLPADKTLSLNSMSKVMTAYGVMLLVQNGQLSLDDPVSKYLPDFAVSKNNVTVRNLLNHSTGLGAYDGDETLDSNSYSSVESAAMAVHDLAPDPSQIGKFQYSSVGYVFLGDIIEKVSHMSYATYMKKNVFDPLGMTQTSAVDDGTLAPGYVGFLGISNIRFDNTPFDVGAGPDGTIHSTVTDIAKFLTAQTQSYPLQTKYREMMLDSKALIPYYAGSQASQGLGWVRHNGDGTAKDPAYLFHNGTGEGYQSMMSIEPSTGNGIVLLSDKIWYLDANMTIWTPFLSILDIEHGRNTEAIPPSFELLRVGVLLLLILLVLGAIYAVRTMKRRIKHKKILKTLGVVITLVGIALVPALLYFFVNDSFTIQIKYISDLITLAFILSIELITVGVMIFVYKPKVKVPRTAKKNVSHKQS